MTQPVELLVEEVRSAGCELFSISPLTCRTRASNLCSFIISGNKYCTCGGPKLTFWRAHRTASRFKKHNKKAPAKENIASLRVRAMQAGVLHRQVERRPPRVVDTGIPQVRLRTSVLLGRDGDIVFQLSPSPPRPAGAVDYMMASFFHGPFCFRRSCQQIRYCSRSKV